MSRETTSPSPLQGNVVCLAFRPTRDSIGGAWRLAASLLEPGVMPLDGFDMKVSMPGDVAPTASVGEAAQAGNVGFR